MLLRVNVVVREQDRQAFDFEPERLKEKLVNPERASAWIMMGILHPWGFTVSQRRKGDMTSPPGDPDKVEVAENGGGKMPERASSEPAPPPDADLVRTFRLMMYRRWTRQCNGHYEKKSKWRLFWPVLLIMLFLLLAGMLSFEKSEGRVVDKIIVTLFILSLVYIMAKVTLRFRWSLYWIALTAIILFFLNPTVSDRTSISSPTAIVLLCFVGLELLTFLVYEFLWHVYPQWICDAPWLNATAWWRIKWRPKSQRSSYQVLDALIWRPVTRHFSYRYGLVYM